MIKLIFGGLLITMLLGCRPPELATSLPIVSTLPLTPTNQVTTAAITPSTEQNTTPTPIPTIYLSPTLPPTSVPLPIPTATPNLAHYSAPLFSSWVYHDRLGGLPTHLAVREPHLYTIVGHYSLVIAHREGDSFFVPVSTFYLGPGRVEELVVENGIAYVTRVTPGIDASNRELILIDVSDAAAPYILATWSGLFNQATIHHNLAFLGEGDTPYSGSGLRILDLSQPEQVQPLGWLSLPTPAGAVALAPPYAYINSGPNLYIADISQPQAPFLVGSVAMIPQETGNPLPYRDTQVAILGNHILARTGQELYLLDRHDPTQPEVVAHYDNVHRLTVGSHRAVVSTPTGFYGSDVLYAFTAEQIEWGEPVLASVGPLNDLAEDGDLFYTLDNYIVYQINPAVDNLAQSRSNEVYFPASFSTEAIVVVGENLYIVTEAGINLWSVSQPLQPKRLETPFRISADLMIISGDYLITLTQDVVTQRSILEIHDRTKGQAASWISSLALPDITHVQAIHQIGSQLYLAVPNLGVIIVDLSNVYQPQHLTTLTWPNLSGAAADNNTLYTAVGNQIEVWDVHDPNLPSLISTLPMVDNSTGRVYTISDIVLDGPWLYIALGGFETAVIDVSNPQQLNLVAIVPLDVTYGLTISGSYLFGFTPNPVTDTQDLLISPLPLQADENKFIRIPTVLQDNTGYLTNRLALVEDVLFVASGSGGLQMIQLQP